MKQLELIMENYEGVYFCPDPYSHQKTRINEHKFQVMTKHKNSKGGLIQLEMVYNLFKENPSGLTDKEISLLIESNENIRVNPSTVSARRNDILNGKIDGYTIKDVINPITGKPLIRSKGIVHKLERRVTYVREYVI